MHECGVLKIYITRSILLTVWGGVIMIEEKKASVPKPKAHNLVLENRKKLSMTGIIDVDSFNEDCIVAQTDLGAINIKGSELHITKLNIDINELQVEGEISSIVYMDSYVKKKGGVFSKIFS